MALTVPQATLIGMWITLLETSRQRRLDFVTWLIAAITRFASMALLSGAMLLTINNTSLGGFVWGELVYVSVLPMLVATAIGTLLRYLTGIRLAAVESGGPGGTFTITDLFACLALIGLVIAIFRILPELEFVVVDTSLAPIFATLTASLAMYLGAARKRCSFLVCFLLAFAFAAALPFLDVLIYIRTDSSGSWDWPWWQFRNDAIVYLSSFSAVWLATRFLMRSGFVLKTNRHTPQI